jgi:cytochrome c
MSLSLKKITLAALTVVIGLSMDVSAYAQDAKKGKRVWMKCQICHRITDDGRKSTGPNLYTIFGRKAGSLEGYKYSKAMLKGGAEGLVWTEENIRAQATNPRKFMKGSKMAFAGIKKPKDMDNLIAYMRQETSK